MGIIIMRALGQLLLTLLLAPLTFGIIKKIKAWSQHRIGAPVLQTYFDIAKLMKKDVIVSETASWIFRATPYVYFVSALTAAVLIPSVTQLFSFGFAGDAIFAVYILALGRFFLTMSGLDTGSAFGGMGSSREMMIASLIEPSVIVSLFTLGMVSTVKSLNIQSMYQGVAKLGWGVVNPTMALILIALFIVTLAETARIPVDDPATHLELTMVHEAMVLEYSGRYFALIQLAAAVKQLVFATLIVNLFMPFGFSGVGAVIILANIGVYIVKIILTTIGLGLIEINSVKLRLFSVPNLAALAFILSILGFFITFVLGGV
jgi:formate hydrogenlyase subunit 4